MKATAEAMTAMESEESERAAQRDQILRLLKMGDAQAIEHRYPEATLTYYSIFDPDAYSLPSVQIDRVAPLELYEMAANRLKIVATRYAQKLIESGCYLAAESHDGIVGVPRGALNLYLISNQYDVFTWRALEYAAKEQARRNICRFLMSSVRARLERLRYVGARAPLLSVEKEAFDVLADFEARLHLCLAPPQRATCDRQEHCAEC